MTPQHLVALDRANEIRLARAEVKRALATGQHSILAVITDPPKCCHSAKPLEMLQALPRVGEARAERIVVSARVGFTRELGSLTDSERQRLCMAVRNRLRTG